MNRATPKLRKFAEQLISVAAMETESSALKPPAHFTVIEKLRPYLMQVVGDFGFSAVLSHALAIAKENFSWLHTVQVKPDGSLNGLDQLEVKIDDDDIAQGQIILIAEFVNLLVELIGERLTLAFIHQALPNASVDDLYFGKGT